SPASCGPWRRPASPATVAPAAPPPRPGPVRRGRRRWPRVGRILVGGDQVERPAVGPFIHLLDQLSGMGGGAFPHHHTEHQPALGIQGHVVPAVAAALLAGPAVPLLLGDEGPLLIELHLTGVRGKKPPARRGSVGRGCRPAGRSGPRCLYRPRSAGPSGG